MTGRHKFSELEAGMTPRRRARIDRMADELGKRINPGQSLNVVGSLDGIGNREADGADELIDLTKIKPSAAFTTFGPTDLVLIVGTGCVGFLAREAFRHFFPGRPTVVEQLKILAELIDACGKTKARSLKVRISTDAKIRWEMPKPIQEAKILGENHDTIDLEIMFA